MNLNLDLAKPEEVIELVEYGENVQTPSTPGFNKISIEEIEEVFRRRNFRRGFSMFDENKDGLIDLKELKGMLRKMGNTVPSDVARNILKMCDENHDGYLNLYDFVKMVNHPELKVLFERYLHKYVRGLVPRRNALDEPDCLYEDQFSCWPPPIWMLAISIVIIVFFAIDATYDKAIYGTGAMGTLFIYNPRRRYEVWRFFTYMFVHIGYNHLIVNVVVQLLLGIPLEMVHKGWRVLLVYFAGVIAGSMASSLVQPHVLLAGASGGVYSLITAHIASIIINWKEMSTAFMQIIVFGGVITYDLWSAMYHKYYLEIEDRISHEAHIAGALTGLLVGFFVLRNLRRNTCENRLWWIGVITFVLFNMFVFIWHFAYPEYYPKQV